MPGGQRLSYGLIGHRQNRTLLNPVRIHAYPGQKEPRILRQLDMLHFRGIEVFAYRRRASFSALAMASCEVSPTPLRSDPSAILMKLHPRV